MNIDSARAGFGGSIRIFQSEPNHGGMTLERQGKNLVTYQGSDILAGLLGGRESYSISHVYVSFYNNPASPPASLPAPNLTDTVATSYYPYYMSNAGEGVIKIPLSLRPSYMADGAGYQNNVAVFAGTVSAISTPLLGAAGIPGASQLYQVGLVAQQDPNDPRQDLLFSRANFLPIGFSPGYNLTIMWGIKFQSN